MPLQNLTKRLGANWMDQRQTERQPRGDMEDLSPTQSRAQVSQRRRKEKGGGLGEFEGGDASWWKWCKSPGPAGNTELMWVTSAKTSKGQREGGHLEDMTPQICRGGGRNGEEEEEED